MLNFIRESPVPVGKKEIARAFHIHGADRVLLKAMLKELRQEGLLDRHEGRRLSAAGGLPEVAVVEVTGPDSDGELLARPSVWRGEGEAPKIYMAPERRGRTALGSGDRVLARLKRIEEGAYEGRTIRVLGGVPKRVLGIFERTEKGGRLKPTDRRARNEFVIRSADTGGAKPGELVLAALKPHHRRLGPARGGRGGAPRQPGRRPRAQPDLDPRARHPDRVPARGGGRSRGGRRRSSWASAKICAACPWSPSTAPTPATSTTRSGPSPIPTQEQGRLARDRRDRRRRPLRPAGQRAGPDRLRARQLGLFSRTGSCRCCPRSCRTAGAR